MKEPIELITPKVSTPKNCSNTPLNPSVLVHDTQINMKNTQTRKLICNPELEKLEFILNLDKMQLQNIYAKHTVQYI